MNKSIDWNRRGQIGPTFALTDLILKLEDYALVTFIKKSFPTYTKIFAFIKSQLLAIR